MYVHRYVWVAYVNGAINTPNPDRTERNLVAAERSCHGLDMLGKSIRDERRGN